MSRRRLRTKKIDPGSQRCMACGETGPQIVTFVACKDGRSVGEWDACQNHQCMAKAKDIARKKYKEQRRAA